MANPRTAIAIAVVAGFTALLAYTTLSAQKTECFVKVEYNSLTDSATASAATKDEAIKQAQTTACGPIAKGMNESIACGRLQPVEVRCREL